MDLLLPQDQKGSLYFSGRYWVFFRINPLKAVGQQIASAETFSDLEGKKDFILQGN